VVVHEFPLRPDPFVEEISMRRGRRFASTATCSATTTSRSAKRSLDELEMFAGPGESPIPTRYEARHLETKCRCCEQRGCGRDRAVLDRLSSRRRRRRRRKWCSRPGEQVSAARTRRRAATATELAEQLKRPGCRRRVRRRRPRSQAAGALGATSGPVVADKQEAVVAHRPDHAAHRAGVVARAPARGDRHELPAAFSTARLNDLGRRRSR